MIYLKLFLTFLEIGAVSFGGGYGMISLMREKCVGLGWLTEGEFLNFIAVAESTPGPIAVNMATFVGSSEIGCVKPVVIGLILATAATMALSVLVGVTTVTGGYSFSLPSVIILAIIVSVAMLWKHFRKKPISPILLILLSAALGVVFF